MTGSPAPVMPRRRSRRRAALLVALALLVGVVAAAVIYAYRVYRVADEGVTRVPVRPLTEQAEGEPLNILIVGSDSRDGLTERQLTEYTLGLPGEVDGQRSDTVLLVSILGDRSGASIVSFPRDLYVLEGESTPKLTEVFDGGPDSVVEVVQTNTGIPIHHYVEVSIPGFISVIETLETVTICLEEPLTDLRSGARLEAGCQEMGSREALAYVRSRSGDRGDFERIERQQKFLRAVLRRLVDTRMLLDPAKLLRTAEVVGEKITTDEGLDARTAVDLALELRELVSGEVPMAAVPSYLQTIRGKSFVVGYGPGVRSIFASIRTGEPLAPRGTPEERAESRVVVWTAGEGRAADLVVRTLRWSGFDVRSAGRGPVDGAEVTRVYVVPGHEDAALWVAATLGAPRLPFPADTDPPEGASVVVVASPDATT